MEEMKTDQQILDVFPLMNQLRTHLTEEEYLELVKESMQVDRYKLLAGYVDDTLVAVAGYKKMTTLYYGRFIWVCDFVTDSEKRSNGFGKELLAYVEQEAIRAGIQTVALSSGLQRERAHGFYERNEYKKVSFVFKKSLES